MPEIGATLRETRMRERIDITEVETATKIRAKYLRALENEEWDLLPGPTFVKTFLRTYAEYLGLDAKLLVEEYKQRFERPSPQELMPFGGSLGARRQRRAPVIPPFAIVGVSIVALLVLLFFLGSIGGDEEEPSRDPGLAATPTPTEEPRRTPRKRNTAARRVRVQIVGTGVVNVCMVDTAGKVLIRSKNFAAGEKSRTYSGRRFRVTFGNGAATLRVNGRAFDVPDRREPVGYEITPGRRRELSAARRPTCAS